MTDQSITHLFALHAECSVKDADAILDLLLGLFDDLLEGEDND